MYIYIGIVMITTLIVYIGDKIGCKDNKYGRWGGFLYTRGIWLSCAILIIFVSFRSNMTADDTNVYFEFFCNPYKGFAELGYYYLNVFVRSFTNNFNVFLGICSFLAIFPVFYVINKQEKEKWIYVFLYQALLLYTFCFAIIRQSIAMGFLTLGVYLFLTNSGKKSYIYFMLCVLVAFLFHRISLIAIPLVFLKKIKFTKKNLIVLCGLGVLVLIFHNFILSFLLNSFFPDKAEMYLGTLKKDFGLIPCGIFIINYLILNYPKLNISLEMKKYYNDINTYFILITVFLFWFPAYGRILQFGYLNVMMSVGTCFSKMNRTGKIMCVIFFAILYLYLMTRNPYHVIPYKLFFCVADL